MTDAHDEDDAPSGVETLRSDLQGIQERFRAGTDRSAEALWNLLGDEIFPFLESLTNEMGEMDEALEEVAEGMPEALHAETSAVFVGIIASGRVLIADLARRIGNTEPKLSAAIREWRKLAQEGEQILQNVTVVVEEEDDGDRLEGPDEKPVAEGSAAP